MCARGVVDRSGGGGARGRRLRTGVLKRAAHPRWAELLVLDVDGATELAVAVRDWSRIKQHRCLGAAAISLLGLLDGHERVVDVALQPRGTLSLCLRFDDYQCLFGLPLADAISRETKGGSATAAPPPPVPAILWQCLSEIENRGCRDVGLYRVSGGQAAVRQLRDAFIKNPRSVDVRGGAASSLLLFPLFLAHPHPRLANPAVARGGGPQRQYHHRRRQNVSP